MESQKNQRGGMQVIPRPKSWRLGDVSPWFESQDREIEIARIEGALKNRVPTGTRGRIPTGEERDAAVLVCIYDEDDPHSRIDWRGTAVLPGPSGTQGKTLQDDD